MVSSECAFGVDVFGWTPPGAAVEHDGPPALSDGLRLMPPAGQTHRVNVGLAVSREVWGVVHLGLGGALRAARERAPSIPRGQHPALPDRGEPTAAAVGEDPAGVVEHDRDHPRVCSEPQRFGNGQGAAVVSGRLPDPPFQVPQPDGDHQRRRHAGGGG